MYRIREGEKVEGVRTEGVVGYKVKRTPQDSTELGFIRIASNH